MELSINYANLGGRVGLEKSVEIYKNAGFTAMDYSLGRLVEESDPMCGNDYKEAVAEINAVCKKFDFLVNQTHAPFKFNNIEAPWHYEEVLIPRIIRAIEISAMLGAKVIVIHPLHHYLYKGNEEEIFLRNMDYFRRLIPYAKEFDIKIGVENMFQRDPLRKIIVADTCAESEEFIRYIDTLDSQYITACLDVGHIGLALREDEAWDVIRALGKDRLGALHIHDNNYANDQHNIPFHGKIDWNKVTEALGEIDYTGDFTYECNSNFCSSADEGFLPVAAKYMADIGWYLIDKIEKARNK